MLAVLLGVALPATRAAQALDACGPAFREGPFVWYAFEPLPPEVASAASGCASAGPNAQVRIFVRGDRAITYCDVEVALPPAMMAEFDAAQRENAVTLPSTRRGPDEIWAALTRRHSAELVCGPGFARMSDAASGSPAVWCRKAMTARQLCPDARSSYRGGACLSSACPAGTVDLASVTRGRLQGCFRCPAGRLDLEESVAWQGKRSPAAGQGPVTEILCRARASDPCPPQVAVGPR